MTDFSKRAFIFDMDGTLVDNMHVHTEAWGQLMTENNQPFEPRDFLVKTAGKTNREILPMVFGPISDERIEQLASRKEEIYREMFRPIRKPHNGVVEFLESARESGVKMAVATASRPRNVSFILDDLDLRRLFDAVVTADDVSHGKPDPEIFLKSAELLGIESGNCIVFEDAFGGFEAARRAGMPAIGIATVNTKAEMIRIDGVVGAYDDFSEIRPQEIIAAHVPETAKAKI
jgi:beta-phosphoglucomutase